MNKYFAATIAFLLPWLTGCETIAPVYDAPQPTMAAVPAEMAPDEGAAEEQGSQEASGVRAGMQRLEPLSSTSRGLNQEDWSDRFPSNDEIRVAIEEMPLSQFLHYAFGELLEVNYVVADGLENLEAPVSLSLQDSVSSRRLFSLTTELLAGRDVGITFRTGVYYLHPLDRRGKGDVFIGFGARAQDVPDRPGPIMQIIPLRYGVSASVERTIRDLVDAKVVGDPTQGALFVTGERFDILRVLDVVRLLDQPGWRGRYVGLVSMTYVTTDEFIGNVVELLNVEGVPVDVGSGAGNGAVALVSLESIGAVAVFATSRQLLGRVDFWARQLDRPAQGAERRYYIYTPRYARADEIGMSLVPLLGDPGVAGAQADARDTRSALGSPAARAAVDTALQSRRDDRDNRGSSASGSRSQVSVRSENLTMAVDQRSNVLIFNTTGTRYQALLPMIRRLDTPPRQILVEATIAEVLLTDEFAMGVEFALENSDVSLGTTGGLGLAGWRRFYLGAGQRRRHPGPVVGIQSPGQHIVQSISRGSGRGECEHFGG